MNLLITGAWQNAAQHFNELKRMGHCVEFMQWEKEPLPCTPEWVEGVVCNGLFLHHDISRFPNLRYIQLTSAGFDRVDMAYVQAHGITIHNAGDTYAIPMAEHVLCGVLMLYRQMPKFLANQQLKLWSKERFLPELNGKQVLILGCGAVGQACARRFAAMGCAVTGIARTPRPIPGFDSVHTLAALSSLLPLADVVILALPASPDTKQLFNAETFAKMKLSSILVNIARGELVDETALANALNHGQLAGAILDVLTEEPLSFDSPLWEMPNVIITPHNSFVGEGNAHRLSDCAYRNLSRS